MRLTVRTLMLLVALVGLGLASPEPVLALTLIFTCPLWLVVYARRTRATERPNETEVKGARDASGIRGAD